MLFSVLLLVICDHGCIVFLAGFYLLAKIEEASDKLIYNWTYHIVSGHTLKHLCAAMVPVFLTLMLAKRTIEPDRQLFLVLYSFNFSNLSLCIQIWFILKACAWLLVEMLQVALHSSMLGIPTTCSQKNLTRK